MKPSTLRQTLAVVLLLGSLGTLGCHRDADTPAPSPTQQAQAQPSAPPPPVVDNPPLGAQSSAADTAEPQTNELQPKAPQEVVVNKAAPPTAAGDLEAKEKQLAKRQAALDAREKKLRQQEARTQRAPRREPTAPKPDPMDDDRAPAADSRADAPAPEAAPEPEPAPLAPTAPQPEPVTVAAGTAFEAELTKGLASNTSAAGDIFRARIASDVVQDGVVVIPGGSEVVGMVTEAVGLGRVGGQAKLSLKFTDLVLPSGSTVPIQASLIQEGRNETRRSATTIGGSAAGGAILGRILSGGNRTKGTVIGALVGAIAGTAIAAKTGQELVIPEGTVLKVKLDNSVRVRPPA